jgi:hypothetical protein
LDSAADILHFQILDLLPYGGLFMLNFFLGLPSNYRGCGVLGKIRNADSGWKDQNARKIF